MFTWEVSSSDGFLVEGASADEFDSFMDLKGHVLSHGVPISFWVKDDEGELVNSTKLDSIEELQDFEDEWDI